MTGASAPARSSAQDLVHPFHAPEGVERIFQGGAEIDASDQHAGPCSSFPLDPLS